MTSTSAGGRTLTELLQVRLRNEPEAVACVLVDADGVPSAVTVENLLQRAMAYANRFGPGRDGRQIVGVCLYHGLDLLAAFVGGLWSGHIPTMLPPPSPRMDPAKYAGSFRRMLEHIRPKSMVVDSAVLAKLETGDRASFAGVDLIAPPSVQPCGAIEPAAAHPDDVALLQHSSGTTGLQKGVALSHRAILEHNEAYAEFLGIGADDVVVSWLPLYHDMGLVACFLLPLLRGVRFVEISPLEWVLRPSMLFEQIQSHRGTLCWLPNFAYSFLADSGRMEGLDGLDLSSVRAWINCSEPVQDASHTRFLARFAQYGVRAAQFTASYAMAENVFAVTQSLPGRYRTLTVKRRPFVDTHTIEPCEAVDVDGLTFVSSGRRLKTTELVVLDPDGVPLRENRVGELAIRGTHTFSGYFRRDDLTAEATRPQGWFATGDLGFLHDDEVFVTGRKKDLVIIQGRNFYPADVEAVAARVPGVVPGRVVAFGLTDPQSGTERLIVVAEVDEAAHGDEKRMSLRIRSAIAQELDCTPGDVRVVADRWLVKSTSGKLARNDNRDKYVRTFLTPGTNDV